MIYYVWLSRSDVASESDCDSPLSVTMSTEGKQYKHCGLTVYLWCRQCACIDRIINNYSLVYYYIVFVVVVMRTHDVLNGLAYDTFNWSFKWVRLMFIRLVRILFCRAQHRRVFTSAPRSAAAYSVHRSVTRTRVHLLDSRNYE